jgi:cytochrome c-type biogenesis protein CcmH/NrfG
VLAERLATRLASTDPGDGNGWALLARAYAALGRKEEAVVAFDRARMLLGDSDMQLQADQTSARAALMASRHPARE